MQVPAPSPRVLMCTLFCVCPPRVESLFPPVLSKSCNQIPLAFKVWFSGNSSFHCRTPRLGSLTWGSEPSLQWVDLYGIIVLQFVSHPPSGYGIWFYCNCTPPTVSLQLLLCLWMWGIFFGEFQCLPAIDCSAVVVPVLLQERVSVRPSTPPSWTNLLMFSFKLHYGLVFHKVWVRCSVPFISVQWLYMKITYHHNCTYKYPLHKQTSLLK